MDSEKNNKPSIEMDDMKLTEKDGSAEKAKIVPKNDATFDSQNGEAKIDIVGAREPLTFAGMGKEELMKFANDPFWVRLRWSLFILFWLIWLAMLGGAVYIIITAPRCAQQAKLQWWQKSVVYKILPDTFQDSNGDGIGDLRGIEKRADYLQKLGINTVWIGAINKQDKRKPYADITDYNEVDPTYGTIDDFKSLVKTFKTRDIKVVLDFVPNHSSNQHAWFNKSRHNETGYQDYYVWANGRGDGPPNNWLNTYGTSAWTKDLERKQYYYHHHEQDQPDLNLRNPAVKEALKEVLHFWIGAGVSGFSVNSAPFIYESKDLEDETFSQVTQWDLLEHNKTANQPELIELLSEWRRVLNDRADGVSKVLITDVYKGQNVADLYGQFSAADNTTLGLVNLPLNRVLLDLTATMTANDVYERINSTLRHTVDPWAWPNWMLGNEESQRLATRLGPNLSKVMTTITMLVGGTQFTYYGDELGLPDTGAPGPAPAAEKVYFSAMALMPWDNSTYGGFSEHNTNLVVQRFDAKLPAISVKLQESNTHSPLRQYNKLTTLRQEPAIQYGTVDLPVIPNHPNVFGLARGKKGSPGYIVLANFGNGQALVNLTSVEVSTTFTLPEEGTVEFRTGESHMGQLKLSAIEVGGAEAVVVKFVPAYI